MSDDKLMEYVIANDGATIDNILLDLGGRPSVILSRLVTGIETDEFTVMDRYKSGFIGMIRELMSRPAESSEDAEKCGALHAIYKSAGYARVLIGPGAKAYQPYLPT